VSTIAIVAASATAWIVAAGICVTLARSAAIGDEIRLAVRDASPEEDAT